MILNPEVESKTSGEGRERHDNETMRRRIEEEDTIVLTIIRIQRDNQLEGQIEE